MRIVLFGIPGIGKGTQAALLARRRGLRHVSTGVMLRAAAQEDTPLGQQIAGYMDQGFLVPDECVHEMVESALQGAGMDRFVLDGYPRTLMQAEWLKAFLDAYDVSLDWIIALSLDTNRIIERLSMRRVHALTGENYHLEFKPPPPDIDPGLIIQRKDDRSEAIRKRIEEYHAKTKPVLDYYRERGMIAEVDADGPIEEIYARIEGVLYG